MDLSRRELDEALNDLIERPLFVVGTGPTFALYCCTHGRLAMGVVDWEIIRQARKHLARFHKTVAQNP